MKQPTELQPLIAHAPKAMVKKIDAAAKRANRSRSAEIRHRLEESLARDADAATARQPATR